MCACLHTSHTGVVCVEFTCFVINSINQPNMRVCLTLEYILKCYNCCRLYLHVLRIGVSNLITHYVVIPAFLANFVLFLYRYVGPLRQTRIPSSQFCRGLHFIHFSTPRIPRVPMHLLHVPHLIHSSPFLDC